MYKKILKSTIIIFTMVILGLFIKKIVFNTENQQPFAETFPSLSFIDTDYNLLNPDTLSASYLICIFYSSDCLFCQHQAKELSRSSNAFKETKIFFITNQSPDSALLHKMRFRLDTISNYYSLVDTTVAGVAVSQFGIRSIPTTLIYGKDRKLMKTFEGEVNAKTLLTIISSKDDKKQERF